MKINKNELFDVGEAAKMLDCGLGKILLYDWLRIEGFIDGKKIPRLDLMEKGLLTYRTGVVKHRKSSFPFTKVYFSYKGIEWLREEYKKSQSKQIA